MTAASHAPIRLLVTGGSGFLGTQVLDEVAGRGFDVHAFGRNPPDEARRNISWHRADILSADASNILRAVAPTHCLHLAWEATPGYYVTAAENYDWQAATLRLASAFFSVGGSSFIMAGSCAEYALPAETCDELATPLSAATPYAACKVETARLVAALAAEAGARFASGRIFFMYGPREPPEKLVATICRGLASGRPIPLSSGADVLDYVFAGDVARALVSLALSNVSGPVNIASGTGTAVRDIANRLAAFGQRPDLLLFGQIPSNREPVRIVADVDRLNQEVGFRPLVSLDAGLRECYNFWTSEMLEKR